MRADDARRCIDVGATAVATCPERTSSSWGFLPRNVQLTAS